MKMCSLFDGSGGFPLAGTLCGIEPVTASEVEPYPIAVTKSRFPTMKHLGDVSKINGAEIEPVDIITFGSPCQDLSVAGKRAGLKHEEHGDEETTRSGLFMEAVRIIKEMREATDGKYPTFALWENVPGAFSSNRGGDFRVVLEELIKIKEPRAKVPPAEGGKWPYADVYMGEGWSLAYRTLDSQYWGVPQRRRRIYLVADFRGERAGTVLFERDGLQWNTPESREERQDPTIDAGNSPQRTDRQIAAFGVTTKGNGDAFINPQTHTALTVGGGQAGQGYPCVLTSSTLMEAYQHHGWRESERAGTLTAAQNDHVRGDTPLVVAIQNDNPSSTAAVVCLEGNGTRPSHKGDGYRETDKMYTLNTIDRHAVAYAMQGFGDYKESEQASGLKARDYKDATDLVCIGIDRAAFNQGENAKYDFTITEQQSATLVARGPNAVLTGAEPQYIVRRLTPTECCRLQGFPDGWGEIDPKEDFTDEEYKFWHVARNTHATINGKKVQAYTKEQMLTWYNKLHTDSAEYKMWGNGIALPTALYVMQGIAEELKKQETP